MHVYVEQWVIVLIVCGLRIANPLQLKVTKRRNLKNPQQQEAPARGQPQRHSALLREYPRPQGQGEKPKCRLADCHRQIPRPQDGGYAQRLYFDSQPRYFKFLLAQKFVNVLYGQAQRKNQRSKNIYVNSLLVFAYQQS
jgi:hypothetical protein